MSLRKILRFRVENLKSTIVVSSLLIVSLLYFYWLVRILKQSIDPNCVASSATSVVDLWILGSIEVKCAALTVNVVGDYFAGLIALLTTVWLVVAFIWQALELSFQRKEFIETNRIAQQRSSSEETWRRLELFETLLNRLILGANEAIEMRCNVLDKRRGDPYMSLSGVQAALCSDLLPLEPDDFESSKVDTIKKFNSKIQKLNAMALALDDLRKDPSLLHFSAILD